MQTEVNQYCCGVFDLDGACEALSANGAKRFVEEALEQAYYNDGERQLPAHLIFTQASSRRNATKGYGFRIADYIRSQELGTVTGTPSGENPRTGNFVTVFVWTPNAKADKLAARLHDGDNEDVDFE